MAMNALLDSRQSVERHVCTFGDDCPVGVVNALLAGEQTYFSRPASNGTFDVCYYDREKGRAHVITVVRSPVAAYHFALSLERDLTVDDPACAPKFALKIYDMWPSC
jgi:hypothetical protein